MKIALFTGTAYRHLYYANTIAACGNVVLHVKTTRSNNLTDEVKGASYSAEDTRLLQEHSDLRLAKEREYFLSRAEEQSGIPMSLEVPMNELNTEQVIDAVRKSAPDVVLVYGTGLIKSALLSAMPKWVINLHAGLSPYYRGGATLYWPVYFMQPQYVGYTLHIIDTQIDHGAILHQNRPEIKAGDTIHDLGCRTIVVAAADTLKLLDKIKRNDIEFHEPHSAGRVFYEADFKPYHLRVTDYLMKNGLFAEYLQHKDLFPDPRIIQQV